MENFPEKLVPSQRMSANLVIQLAVHLLTRSIPISDSVDVSGTGTDTAQAVRQFLKIVLKLNPQQMHCDNVEYNASRGLKIPQIPHYETDDRMPQSAYISMIN